MQSVVIDKKVVDFHSPTPMTASSIQLELWLIAHWDSLNHKLVSQKSCQFHYDWKTTQASVKANREKKTPKFVMLDCLGHLLSNTLNGMELLWSRDPLFKMSALFSSPLQWEEGRWVAQSLLIEWFPKLVEPPGLHSACDLLEQKQHCTWRRLHETITVSWMRPDCIVNRASNPSPRSKAWPQSHNTRETGELNPQLFSGGNQRQMVDENLLCICHFIRILLYMRRIGLTVEGRIISPSRRVLFYFKYFQSVI